MQISRVFILHLFLMLSGFVSTGQSPMGYYFLESLPQTLTLNPAFQPETDIYVSLPSAGISLQLNPSFNDLFQPKNETRITPLSNSFDYQRLYSSIGREGNLNMEAHIDILGAGIRTKNHYFNVSLSVRNISHASIPSDLFKITEKGFPDNTYFDFSTAHIKQLIYKEIAISYSRKWTENLSFGFKIKPIFGMAGGITHINSLNLITSRTEWYGQIDGRANFSGPVTIEASELEEIPQSFNVNNNSIENFSQYLTSWKNGGMAIDVGTIIRHYNWTFYGSLIDIGLLRFTNDLNQMSFNGSYSFTGISMSGFDENELNENIDEIADTLNNLITYNVDRQKFNMWLTPKLYLGASYIVNPLLSVGFLTRTVFQKHQINQELHISANIRPAQFLELNLNYNLRPGGSHGPGASLVIGTSPLQFYLGAEYLPLRYAMVSFDDSKSFPVVNKKQDFSFKAGINLIFNKPKKRTGSIDCPEAYGLYY